MDEDFGFGGDEFLIGDCQDDWFNPIDQGQWDDDPNPYEGNYSEE